MMKDETWLNSDQAMDLGFVDEITEQIDMAACVKFVPVMAKLGFQKIPETIKPKQPPTAKAAERALRDAGFSVKASKTILAKGLTNDLRDVDQADDPLPATDPLRDVETREPVKKDRVHDLLIRAEMMAPSK